MAGHTITDDVNIDDIDWDEDDDFVIENNATLTINSSQSKRIGQIIVDIGTLKIENTSTSDGWVLNFSGYEFIDVRSLGKLDIQGDLIEVHTSDGSDDQKFNFWDDSYPYDIPGIFVDGEEPIAMNSYMGNDDIDIDNDIVRYYAYDKDNAEFTLDHYYPDNDVKIYAPNIIIKRDDSDEDNGSTTGFVKLEASSDAYISKIYLIAHLKTSYSQGLTCEDVIFGQPATFYNSKNLTINRTFFISYSNSNAVYFKNNDTTTCNDYYQFGGCEILHNKNMSMNNCYLTNPRKARQSYLWFYHNQDIQFNNVKCIYQPFYIMQYCKNMYIKDLYFQLDDDYSDGDNFIHFTGCEDSVIENVTTNDDFYYYGYNIITMDGKSKRCKIINTSFDFSHTESNGKYPRIIIKETDECGLYNVSITKDCEDKNPWTLYVYETAKNTFIVDVDIKNRATQLVGENPRLKNLTMHEDDYSIKSLIDAFPTHTVEVDDDGNNPKVYLRQYFGRNDANNIEVHGDNIKFDMYGYKVFFLKKDEYIISKPLKEHNIRKLKSITSHSFEGHNTDNLDFYLSFNGIDWIAEDDWDGTEFPSDDDFFVWFKVISNTDDDDYGTYIQQIILECDIDDNKPEYEPYFYYSKINFTNLPDEMNIGLMVGNLAPILLSNISQSYTHYQLWRESADIVMARIRKYGYSFYDDQGILNDTELDFFYTGYQKNDITMSRDDALNVSDVELKDSDDDDYKYELDCGDNELEDVYHYIQAKLTYHNTDLNNLMSFECNEFLQRDGDKFKTIQVREGEGVKLTNYKGKASKFTKDNGDEYVVPETYIFKLTGIVSGSEVRLYKKDDMSELDGVENLDGDTYEYDYQYNEDTDIIAVVFNVDYQPVRIEATLKDNDTSIPIQQVYDRNYSNP